MISANTDSDLYRVLIMSVGSATPAGAAAVAKGLGLSAAEVISCLYRAPAVLVDQVEYHVARQLQQLLEEMGYHTDIAPVAVPSLPPPRLYDVAVYLTDASQLIPAAERLATFVGMTVDEASKLLLTPPNSVLGSVSAATVTAFRRHMADAADIIDAAQDDSLYDIFLGDMPTVVRKRLLDDLSTAGVTVSNQQGLVASGVEHEQVTALWQRHRANNALRIVNQAFLHFDVVLQVQRLNDKQKCALADLAQIPADLLDEVIATAPITLLECVPQRQVALLLAQFAAAGIAVQADLITFQALRLRIHAASPLTSVNELLQRLAAVRPLQHLPADLPEAYPEIQARVLHHALTAIGAEVELCPA